MKLSKRLVTTILLSTLFASTYANAQTAESTQSSGLQRIVNSLVFNALQNATNEIDSQLENVKESASELFLNLNTENSDQKSKDVNSKLVKEVSPNENFEEIITKVNQTTSVDD